MPQVKIKQGSKSAVNNNAGVLNAGTLAITTDTNELFVTHNDGTVHQLCNPVIDTDQIADLAITKPKLSQDTYDWIDGKVDKAGDTMTGNLNMSGKEVKNVAIEVVTSLPATNNFVGRQVNLIKVEVIFGMVVLGKMIVITWKLEGGTYFLVQIQIIGQFGKEG